MSGTEDKIAIKAILDCLPVNGTALGNRAVLKILKKNGYSDEEFWSAKEDLVKNGTVIPGRGRGGSIRLNLNGIGKVLETIPSVASSGGDDKNELSREDEKRVRKLMMDSLPKDGSTLGNKNLMGKLGKSGVSSEQYWLVRNRMISEGLLAKGRGLGGSVRLLLAGRTPSASSTVKAKYKKEKDLYQPFFDSIKQYWMKDEGLNENDCVIDLTANQGKKKTGGKWTRPDITIVSVRAFVYIPGKILDVITFEIKHANCVDVSGVFETASHSRFAHKSYLSIYLPNGITDDESINESIDRLVAECERFGIGFLYFKDPNDWSTFEILVDPKRQNPDPDEIEKFIDTQLSKSNRDELLKKK